VSGVLDSTIIPAEYVSFINYLDPVQLARFGLHNGMSIFCLSSLKGFNPNPKHPGKPSDQSLIAAKWESFALAPVGDRAFPDDYFLITAVRLVPTRPLHFRSAYVSCPQADNDFISTDGVSLGVPFNAGQDVDNQIFVFRVTLPSVKKGSVESSIGLREE